MELPRMQGNLPPARYTHLAAAKGASMGLMTLSGCADPRLATAEQSNTEQRSRHNMERGRGPVGKGPTTTPTRCLGGQRTLPTQALHSTALHTPSKQPPRPPYRWWPPTAGSLTLPVLDHGAHYHHLQQQQQRHHYHHCRPQPPPRLGDPQGRPQTAPRQRSQTGSAAGRRRHLPGTGHWGCHPPRSPLTVHCQAPRDR